jgi:hypothetical protein
MNVGPRDLSSLSRMRSGINLAQKLYDRDIRATGIRAEADRGDALERADPELEAGLSHLSRHDAWLDDLRYELSAFVWSP